MDRPSDLSVTAEGLRVYFPSILGAEKSIDVRMLAGDASSRQYFRLSFSSGRESLVLQVAEVFTDEVHHPFLAARRLLEKIHVRVPRLVGSAGARGWILLEDLGDETLQSRGLDEALYRQSIDALVKWTLHANFKNGELDAADRAAPNFNWAFDFKKLQAEMAYTAEHLVKSLLKQDAEQYLKLVEANSRWLDSVPRYFCHRDYHSRNLMVKRGELCVIDFQDARMGPVTYDLVSLLWDPYVRMGEELRERLMQYWKSKMGVAASEKHFSIEVERMKLQRLLKAAGSYASFLFLKKRSDYLPGIEPALSDARIALLNLKKLGASMAGDDGLLTWIDGALPAAKAIIKT